MMDGREKGSRLLTFLAVAAATMAVAGKANAEFAISYTHVSVGKYRCESWAALMESVTLERKLIELLESQKRNLESLERFDNQLGKTSLQRKEAEIRAARERFADSNLMAMRNANELLGTIGIFVDRTISASADKLISEDGFGKIEISPSQFVNGRVVVGPGKVHISLRGTSLCEVWKTTYGGQLEATMMWLYDLFLDR